LFNQYIIKKNIMKKANTLTWLMLCILSLSVFSSCEKDDEEKKININIRAKAVIEKAIDNEILNGLEVEIQDTRTMETITCLLNTEGKASIELYRGTYNISIEKNIEGKTDDEDFVYSAKLENCNINIEKQEIDLALNVFPKISKSTNFIFSELFFNGETNSGRMMHPDVYYVIFNPTQETLYADGLCVATTSQPSIIEKYPFYDEYMPNTVPITGFFTFPGTGKEHAVAPGGKIVLAMTAIDHSKVEGHENSVDLTGVDFEVYIPSEKRPDIDNPEVPNVIVTETFYQHPRGFWATLLFKLKDGNKSTVDDFYKNNNKKYVMKNKEETLLILLKSEKIIDGIVTGDRPLVTRPLPESVDRGYFQVSGCHRQELAIRKEIKIGNQIFYKDTNNSDVDFIKLKKQNSFPIGWRNK